MQVLLKTSQNCLSLIKKWEGLYLDAYLNPVGIWTIGYGTTEYPDGKKVKQGDKINTEQAEYFLKYKVDILADEVNKLVRIELTQKQFDALVSFCYNVGVGTLKYSTLLEKLDQGDYQGAANEFPKWNKVIVNGVTTILPGLVDRRDDEKNLFLSNDFISKNELSFLAGLGLFDPMAVLLKPLDWGNAPIKIRSNNELSERVVEEKITWLEVYQKKNVDNTLIVGWTNRELMQLFQLETHRRKKTLVAVNSNSSDSKETKMGQKSFATN